MKSFRSNDRSLNHRTSRYSTRMVAGARRRRDNPIADACRAFRAYLCWRKEFAKNNPGFFDYAAAEQRARAAAERAAFDQELRDALDRVYGPQSDGPAS